LWHLFLLISVPVKPSKDSFKCHYSFENASDDLLNLTGNPFVQNVQQVMALNNIVNNVQPGYSAGGWNSQPPTS
jgi:hypothetical protein